MQWHNFFHTFILKLTFVHAFAFIRTSNSLTNSFFSIGKCVKIKLHKCSMLQGTFVQLIFTHFPKCYPSKPKHEAWCHNFSLSFEFGGLAREVILHNIRWSWTLTFPANKRLPCLPFILLGTFLIITVRNNNNDEKEEKETALWSYRDRNLLQLTCN